MENNSLLEQFDDPNNSLALFNLFPNRDVDDYGEEEEVSEVKPKCTLTLLEIQETRKKFDFAHTGFAFNSNIVYFMKQIIKYGDDHPAKKKGKTHK